MVGDSGRSKENKHILFKQQQHSMRILKGKNACAFLSVCQCDTSGLKRICKSTVNSVLYPYQLWTAYHWQKIVDCLVRQKQKVCRFLPLLGELCWTDRNPTPSLHSCWSFHWSETSPWRQFQWFVSSTGRRNNRTPEFLLQYYIILEQ